MGLTRDCECDSRQFFVLHFRFYDFNAHSGLWRRVAHVKSFPSHGHKLQSSKLWFDWGITGVHSTYSVSPFMSGCWFAAVWCRLWQRFSLGWHGSTPRHTLCANQTRRLRRGPRRCHPSADRALRPAEERLAACEPVDEGALRGVDAARKALARPQRLDWGWGWGSGLGSGSGSG